MKNTIIQGILGAAVIVLFILHFASSKSGNANNAGDNTESPVVASVGEMKIAYVNVDSLVNNLTLWQSLKSSFEEKQEKYNNEISTKQRRLQSKWTGLNDRVQKTLITRANAEKEAADLEKENQSLIQLAEKYRMELVEEEAVSYNQILNEIMEYLKELSATEGYTYVLGNSYGGNILYANKGLDITQRVIVDMNARSAASK